MREAQGKFVEEALGHQLDTRNSLKPLCGLHRIGVVERRQIAQALFPQKRQVDAESERTQAGIGADVGCRFLAANMLFARRECQHKTALPLRVDRLATQASRHLAHKLFLAGKEPDIRPAKLQANAQ